MLCKAILVSQTISVFEWRINEQNIVSKPILSPGYYDLKLKYKESLYMTCYHFLTNH